MSDDKLRERYNQAHEPQTRGIRTVHVDSVGVVIHPDDRELTRAPEHRKPK